MSAAPSEYEPVSPLRTDRLFAVDGRVVLITGGAQGLGFAMAEVLAANGARLCLLDVDRPALAESVERLVARGADVTSAVVDVRDATEPQRAVEQVLERWERLDVAFANAGITAGPGFLTPEGERDPAGAIEHLSPALWSRVLETNLLGVVHTLQAVLPPMRRQRSGSVVVTASIGGMRPSAVVGLPYMVSKAAALHLVRQAALEVAGDGVRINAIAPGPFQTRITSPELAALWRSNPMHRIADPADLHGVALFLASDASAYMTGAEIVVDGGALLGRAD